PRLDAQARSTLAMSLDLVRRAAESALNALQGKPAEAPRRDYELSFPPAPEPAVSVSGQRRRVPATRPAARPKAASERDDSPSELAQEDGPRPVFKRRRGR
ncbi:MAG: hypothetical protein ACJ8BF_07345, partial [Gemmatimonadales bacterium]